jgi:N-acetyl-anhydromuramyl-L-alanine amidase AmpD
MSLDIVRKQRLHPDKYFDTDTSKSQIYLHHTVGGSAASTIGWWNTSKIRVGTSYVVDVNGVVYEVFPPEKWAYHLGLKTNFNKQANMQSIGIEICSEGALRDGGELNAMLMQKGLKGRMRDDFLYAFDINPNAAKNPMQWFKGAKPLYHILHDSDLFVKFEEGYRDYMYFDAYNPEQLTSVFELVKYLCEKFNIPKQLIPHEDKTTFDISLALDFKGILTHANVRRDKSDVHPAFPWSKMLEFIKE